MTTTLSKAEQLAALYALYNQCTACPLGTAGRKQVVFGKGNPESSVVIIGEAPGSQEDEQGKPFVGRSGQLLTRTLASIGVHVEDVYITNIAKCRPPNNRPPTEFESTTCGTLLLKRQLDIMQPKIICTLGATAFYYFCGNLQTITKARGQIFKVKDFLLLPTYHPAYLLRNNSMLPIFQKDLQTVFTYI